MQKWEYMIMTYFADDKSIDFDYGEMREEWNKKNRPELKKSDRFIQADQLTIALNKLGAEGWEVCGFGQDDHFWFWWTLKRPIGEGAN